MRALLHGLLFGVLSLGCGSTALPTGTGGHTGTGGGPATSSSGGAGASSTSSAGTGTGGSTTSSASGSSASSASSASASSSGGLDGGPPNSGDCDTDADCPGSTCVAVTPGGFRVCLVAPEKATTCTNPGFDQCCNTMPCPGTEPCYVGPLVPFCAGIPVQPHNQCAVDQCTADADCLPQNVCAVAGTLDRAIRACVPAACKLDSDCTDQPGGACAPVVDPCCGGTSGLYCVYPNGGCRRSSDCPSGQYCQVNGSKATCQPGAPICPA